MKKDVVFIIALLLLPMLYTIKILASGQTLAVGDGFFHNYPLMLEISRQYGTFSLPLWNPNIFTGFPLLASMQGAVLYPVTFVSYLIAPPEYAYDINILFHFSIAGVFTFLYTRLLGLPRLAAFFSGMVFAVLGYLPSVIIHTAVLMSGAWLPAIVYFLERIRTDAVINRRLSVGNIVGAAVVISLQVYAGHPQVCAYTYLMTVILLTFHLIYTESDGRWRFLQGYAAAMLLGLLLALPQLLATYNLSTLGQRDSVSYEFFSQVSFAPPKLLGLVVPFLFKGVPEVYLGILPLVLAVTAFIKSKRRETNIRLWSLIALIGLMLAFGDNLRPLHKLVYHIPVLGNFRSPSRHWLEISFALSTLSGYGFMWLLDDNRKRLRNAVAAVHAALAILALLFTTVLKPYTAMLMGSLGDLPLRTATSLDIRNPLVYGYVVFMFAFGAVIWGIKRSRKLKYLILLLVFFEALSLRTNYIYNDRTELNTKGQEVFSFLAQRSTGRAAFISLELPDSMLAMNYGISAIDGYDPLIPQRYSRLLNIEMFGYSYEWPSLAENNLILSMLNTRWLVVDDSMGELEKIRGRANKGGGRHIRFSAPISAGLPASPLYDSAYKKRFDNGRISIYENMNSIPRARLVERLRPVAGIDDLRLKLYAFQLDPWVEAALSEEDIKEIGLMEFTGGRAKIVQDTPSEVRISTSASYDAFLILADQYYPDWRAYVDGRRVKLYRANEVQRGVLVPAGVHEVVFRYVPVKLYAAMGGSGLLFAAMLLMLVRSRGKGLRQKDSDPGLL